MILKWKTKDFRNSFSFYRNEPTTNANGVECPHWVWAFDVRGCTKNSIDGEREAGHRQSPITVKKLGGPWARMKKVDWQMAVVDDQGNWFQVNGNVDNFECRNKIGVISITSMGVCPPHSKGKCKSRKGKCCA